MRRSAILVAVVVAGVSGCGSDGGRADTPPRSKPSATTLPSPDSAGSTGSTARRPNPSRARFMLTPVAALDAPTAMAIRADDPALYVTEQLGLVRAIRDGRLDLTPVLDLRNAISSGGERGLLGLAFSPDGATLYVDFTNREGNTRLEAYPMNANGIASPRGRRVLLAIAQPQANHNGGGIVTGPDGMLWIGTGDGGGFGDGGDGHAPEGNGQSRTTLLGKLLRIDPTPTGTRPYSIPPDNPFARGGGLPEIWAYGLRNPWKFSFDADTGALVIGDVGQDTREEIDWVAAGTRPPLNFEWPLREGTHELRGARPPGGIGPILEYPHDGRCAIVGGYIYRGSRIPDLVGTYVFADFCDGRIRGTPVGPGVRATAIDFGVASKSVSGFGQDHQGELYVLSQGVGVLRVSPIARAAGLGPARTAPNAAAIHAPVGRVTSRRV